MTDYMKQIDEATAKLQQGAEEYRGLERDALAHEEKARELRRQRTAMKEELAALDSAVRNLRVLAKIQSEEQIATQKRQEAEALHATNLAKQTELDAKQTELDKLIAKVKADAEQQEDVQA